jgi:hypothetical protein
MNAHKSKYTGKQIGAVAKPVSVGGGRLSY